MRWWKAEDPIDRQLKIHDAILEASRKIAEEAEAQRVHLVAKANGHLVEFQAELGGSKDAGKPGTKL